MLTLKWTTEKIAISNETHWRLGS